MSIDSILRGLLVVSYRPRIIFGFSDNRKTGKVSVLNLLCGVDCRLAVYPYFITVQMNGAATADSTQIDNRNGFNFTEKHERRDN